MRDDGGNIAAALQVCVPAEAATQENVMRWAQLLAGSAKRVTEVIYAVGPGGAYWEDEDARARKRVREEPDTGDRQSRGAERKPHRLV